MKIAVLVGRFPVISEQFIINHVTGLIDAGHEVTVVSARSGDWDNTHAAVGTYELRRYTIVAGLPDSPFRRAVGWLMLLFKYLFIAPVVAVRSLGFHRYQTAAKSGKALYFYSSLRTHRFDVIHCHFGPNGLSGVFLKDSGIASRLVVSFHGSDINTYPKRYGENIYHYLLDRADAVFCNTTFTANKVKKAAHSASGEPLEKRIHVVPVSLDTKDFPVRAYSPRTERFELLTVGRLVEKKGHRYVLEAVAHLRDRIPGLEYHLIGKGGLRGELESTARRLGIDDICFFHGEMTAGEVRSYLEQCDVFILASVTAAGGDMEGQGLVLQEAQSMAVPVISTLHNGIPDGVLDGRSGFLVPEKDITAIETAVLRFVEDWSLIERMGAEGAAFVRANYDTSVVMKRMNEVYNALL